MKPFASPAGKARAYRRGSSFFLGLAALMLLLTPFTVPVTASESPRAQTTSSLPGALPPTALTSPNAQAGGEFGTSVAVGGGLVVVGAQYESIGSKCCAGYAYVFNATSGSPISKLKSPNAQAGGQFGSSVAVNRKLVVVGASRESVGGHPYGGHAYVFNATTDNLIWTLTSPNPVDGFGWSVAVSAKFVAVGAVAETAGAQPYAGNVYLYSATTGSLLRTITSPIPQSDGEFGFSVALRGNSLVAGAPYETASGHGSAGNAYLFNANTGVLVSALVDPAPQNQGCFGYSVSVNKRFVLAGAYGETAGGHAGAGHVYAFTSTTGALIRTFSSPNPTNSGYFGYSVGLGKGLLVVGAYYETSGSQSDAGKAYVFNIKTGALLDTLSSPSSQGDGWFGYSVAIRGIKAVIGAPGETAGMHSLATSLSGAGHAYIYLVLP